MKMRKYAFWIFFLLIFMNIIFINLKSTDLTVKNLDKEDMISDDLEALKETRTLKISNSGFNNLNSSISLNQTAYLPETLMNITLELTNNYSTPLYNVSFNSYFNEGLEVVNGSLNYQLDNLGINETITNSLICRAPNKSPSLDLVFLIDGSGSMNAEIEEVKSKVLDLTHELLQMVSSVRIGVIFFGATLYHENPYRDSRNVLDFTTDEGVIQNFLNPFYGGGGWEPWGDALHYLQQMSWQSTIKMGILITDEPCNYGLYVGTGDYNTKYDYYDGDEVFEMANTLNNLGIIISTIQCYGGYGGDNLLTSQLTGVAEITNGLYSYITDASTLMEQVLTMCETIIDEYGYKITTEMTAIANNENYTSTQYKWILVDNKPPSIYPMFIPIFKFNISGFSIQYRLSCKTFDLAGVSYVKLFYKFDNASNYEEILMNSSSPSLFTYLFPILPEGTVIRYYFNTMDFLGNAIQTIPNNYTVDNSIPLLQPNSFKESILDSSEFTIFKINITQPEDYAIVLQSSGKILCSFISYNANKDNFSLEFNNWPYFGMIHLENFTGFGILCITNTMWNGLNTFKLTFSTISDISIDGADAYKESVKFSTKLSVLLYEVYLDVSIDTYVHCKAETSDEFYYFSMSIFSATEHLKSQEFNRICVEIPNSGYYYIMVQYIDTRKSDVKTKIIINYGYLEDTPYFDGKGELDDNGEVCGEPAYFMVMPLLVILAASGLVGFGIIIALHLRTPYVLRKTDETTKRLRKNKYPLRGVMTGRKEFVIKKVADNMKACGIEPERTKFELKTD